MKTNTRMRKKTFEYIDMSRVSKVVVMPLFGTRAYSELGTNGLPAVFEVEIGDKKSIYELSLSQARKNANELSSKFKDCSYVIEVLRISSKRIALN